MEIRDYRKRIQPTAVTIGPIPGALMDDLTMTCPVPTVRGEAHFSILGLRRARTAGWGTRLPMVGLVLSAVLVVLDVTLTAAAIHFQRQTSRWVEDSWQRMRDQGPNDLGP